MTARAPSEAVLRLQGIGKTFTTAGQHTRLFTELSLELAAGQSLALVGPSGSGKSTLLNLIAGLEAADTGRVHLFGQSMTEPFGDAWTQLRRQRIGVLFQDDNLMPALTLAENIRLRAHLAEKPEPEPGDWLQRLGVGGLDRRYPDQVSGGQRQRAALAMVFAMQPDLLLADEPTASLDRETALQVAEVLFAYRDRHGIPMLLATHDLELAGRCDLTLRLDQLTAPP